MSKLVDLTSIDPATRQAISRETNVLRQNFCQSKSKQLYNQAKKRLTKVATVS